MCISDASISSAHLISLRDVLVLRKTATCPRRFIAHCNKFIIRCCFFMMSAQPINVSNHVNMNNFIWSSSSRPFILLVVLLPKEVEFEPSVMSLAVHR